MKTRAALDVARRCLCLELMHQRIALEAEDDGEEVRTIWLSKREPLGVVDALLADEQALFDKPCGTLTEDDLDDLDGRASGALVLLWALGRLDAPPTFASDVAEVLADRGLLGDGSIVKAAAAAKAATLRPDDELARTLAAYLAKRGKAKEVDDPERIFAEVAAHVLGWVTDDALAFA